jgi:hypothetical protein
MKQVAPLNPIDKSVYVQRQANPSFPRTRESRRGEADACTGMGQQLTV